MTWAENQKSLDSVGPSLRDPSIVQGSRGQLVHTPRSRGLDLRPSGLGKDLQVHSLPESAAPSMPEPVRGPISEVSPLGQLMSYASLSLVTSSDHQPQTSLPYIFTSPFTSKRAS